MYSIMPCWRRSKTKLYKGDEALRNHYLFHKGQKKLDKEFDAIHMIKLMKQVKLLVNVLLNPTQKLLLHFQKSNVINSDTSSEEGTEEDDVKLVNKVKHTNEFIRLTTIGNIKRNLESYFYNKKKITEVDHKLMKGVKKQKFSFNLQTKEQKYKGDNHTTLNVFKQGVPMRASHNINFASEIKKADLHEKGKVEILDSIDYLHPNNEFFDQYDRDPLTPNDSWFEDAKDMEKNEEVAWPNLKKR